MSLQGKVALITGGAKNLGALVATEFADLGASLALHYNSAKTKSDADSLADRLKKAYPNVKVSFYQGDLTTKAAVDKLFDSVMKDFGKLDIVVNTVGMVLKKPLAEVSEKEYDTMFAINSKAAFFIMQGAAKNIADEGRIVSLVTALLGAFTGYYTPYAGSKAPVEHFTRGLSKELADRRITVNAIAPGPMDTPFLYGQETDESIAFLKSVGMGGRLTKIEDVAPLIRFLCTEGGWITGQTIFPNGGFTTR